MVGCYPDRHLLRGVKLWWFGGKRWWWPTAVTLESSGSRDYHCDFINFPTFVVAHDGGARLLLVCGGGGNRVSETVADNGLCWLGGQKANSLLLLHCFDKQDLYTFSSTMAFFDDGYRLGV